MSVMINKQAKQCCTCEYWVGNRKTCASGVELIPGGHNGKCELNQKGVAHSNDGGCAKYKKWNRI